MFSDKARPSQLDATILRSLMSRTARLRWFPEEAKL